MTALALYQIKFTCQNVYKPSWSCDWLPDCVGVFSGWVDGSGWDGWAACGADRCCSALSRRVLVRLRRFCRLGSIGAGGWTGWSEGGNSGWVGKRENRKTIGSRSVASPSCRLTRSTRYVLFPTNKIKWYSDQTCFKNHKFYGLHLHHRPSII